MPDTNTPIRRDDDEADATSVEARMRLALGKLGTKEALGSGGPGGKVMFAQTGSQRRNRFARNGEVPVEHMSASGRTGSDAQRELAIERAARQSAEQALDDTKAGVVRIQVTRDAGLAVPGRMMAPSRFQRWCEYGPRCWRSSEAARE